MSSPQRRLLRSPYALALLAGTWLACAAPLPGVVADARATGRFLSAADGGRWVGREAALRRIARADIVLLGEHHDHPAHHVLQARVIDALVARGRRPVVVFEMLRADQQPAIDAVLAGATPSAEALRRAVHWDDSGWPPFALYAPVFDAALRHGLPIRAAQMSRTLSHRLTREGTAALAGVADADALRAVLTAALPPGAEEALRDTLRRGHCGRIRDSMLPRMIEVQRGWDAWMAREAVAAARRPDVDGAVLIVGRGHAVRSRAVPFAIARLGPGLSVSSVGLLEAGPDATGGNLPAPPAQLVRDARDYDLAWVTALIDRPDPCERIPLPPAGGGPETAPHAPSGAAPAAG